MIKKENHVPCDPMTSLISAAIVALMLCVGGTSIFLFGAYSNIEKLQTVLAQNQAQFDRILESTVASKEKTDSNRFFSKMRSI